MNIEKRKYNNINHKSYAEKKSRSEYLSRIIYSNHYSRLNNNNLINKKINPPKIINHLKMLLFFILIQVIISKENIKKKRYLQSVSEITITIKGKGDQLILSDKNTSYNKLNYKFNNVPDKIIVNGKARNYTGIMVYDLEYEENVITMVFNNTLTECNAMFSGLTNITRIDFSKFDSSKVIEMAAMFYECNSLISINLKNFNTVSVKDMSAMFFGCSKLTSIDVSNFDTSSVIKMNGLFQECHSLLSLDLNNFNTSSVIDMNSMFNHCLSLKILNLQSFDTSSVNNFHGIFKYCVSLLSLNLSSFNTSSANNLNHMFFGCHSLISLDIRHFDTSSIKNIHDMFKETNNKTIYCINEETTPKIMIQLNETKNNYTNNCEDICFTGSNIKFIIEKNKCIEDCSKDDLFSLEYENECYESCPNHTHISSNEHSCEIDSITLNWDINNFFYGENQKKDINSEEKDQIVSKIKDDIINGNIDLTDLVYGDKEDITISVDDTSFQITTTDNQKNNEYKNISTIQLGKCESILKATYNIDPETPLIIFKVDHYIPGVLIPVIGYEFYHPINKTKLDLKYCKDENIDFKIPVSINEDELFKYDPNSEYYTDECNSYTTDSGTDILLEDRQKEFNNDNYSLCENNCNFSEYSLQSKKSICQCAIKSKEYIISEMINDENILSTVNFTSNSSSTNMASMKCIYNVFTKEGLIKNVGNYILILIILTFSILALLFFKIGQEILLYEINQIIKSKTKKQNKNKDNIIDIYSNSIKNVKTKKFSIKLNPNIRKNKKKESNDGKKSTVSIMSLKNGNNLKINVNKKAKKIEKKIKVNECYDCEINSLSYKNAIKCDNRTFFQYYISLLKAKHPIVFSFFPIKDYNSIIIKISLFLILFSVNYIVNALFFNDSKIHRIYLDKGDYNYGYFIPKLFLYFLISHILYTSIKYITLSERNILEIKNNKKNSIIINKNKRCLNIKYICYFSFGVLFLCFSWYYLSSFCAVYKNSQTVLIKNTLICLVISFIYPIIINLIPPIFRRISLNSQDKEALYIISKVIQII